MPLVVSSSLPGIEFLRIDLLFPFDFLTSASISVVILEDGHSG